MTKRCGCCRRSKDTKLFSKNKTEPDGYDNYCKQCRKQYRKQWEKEHPGQRRQTERKSYQRHRKARLAYLKQRYATQGRWKTLQKTYGVTREQYLAQMKTQKGLCAICHRPSPYALQIDHNHQTGNLRGLLCCGCNRALGLFHDDPAVLTTAITYLRTALFTQ